MQKLFYRTSSGGDVTYARFPSTSIYNLVYSGAGSKNVTTPDGANIAIISSTADFWFQASAGGAVPTGDITDGTGVERNPTIIDVSKVVTFSIATSAAAKISICFYA